MEVKIRKLSDEELKNLGVEDWPIWRREVSEFDWYYDTNEDFYVLEGEVEVTTDGGKTYRFGEGGFCHLSKRDEMHLESFEAHKKEIQIVLISMGSRGMMRDGWERKIHPNTDCNLISFHNCWISENSPVDVMGG